MSYLQANETIGKYELLYPIGGGAMGEVWAARFLSYGDVEFRVALKIIHARLAAERRFREAFLEEVRAGALISHPNAVGTFDLGVEGEVLYQAMEYVEGDTLVGVHQRVRERGERVPLAIALRIAADLCAGLHAAHELQQDGEARSILHRDVSPRSVLLGTNGVVKLRNFGLSQLKARLAEELQPGWVDDDPSYVSPEQARGSEVDRRTDVYSVGVVLYELVCNRLPHDRTTNAAYRRSVSAGEPPAEMPRDVPAEVCSIVLRAIAADREARYPTAQVFRDDLEALLRKHPPRMASFASACAARRDTSLPASRADSNLEPPLRAARARAVAMTITENPPAIPPSTATPSSKGSPKVTDSIETTRPALLFLHGFSLDHRMWRAQIEALHPAYRVVTADLPGFGPQARDCGLVSPAEQLTRVMDKCGALKAHLIGHSIGAAVAIDFALLFPRRVLSLTLVDPLMLGRRTGIEAWGRCVSLANEGDLHTAIDVWLDDPLYAPARRNEKLFEEVRAMALDYRAAHWLGRVTNRWSDPDPYPRLEELDIPALVIGGKLDIPSFKAMADAYARALPKVRREELDDVGHLANMEAPARFNRLLIDFIEQVSPDH